MSFENIAAGYDRWYQSPEGKYVDEQEKQLFLRLVQPQSGQSLLEIGCGTGHNVTFFESLGLRVNGIDSCEPMLEIASGRCADGTVLCPGEACQLAFSDNSFDITAMITSLEFITTPKTALEEALRVSRDRVYLGILNRLSLIGISRRVKSRLNKKSIYRQAHFYSIWEIEHLVRGISPAIQFDWESALFFPWGWHHYLRWMDKHLSLRKNPFGAFLGVVLTKPSYS